MQRSLNQRICQGIFNKKQRSKKKRRKDCRQLKWGRKTCVTIWKRSTEKSKWSQIWLLIKGLRRILGCVDVSCLFLKTRRWFSNRRGSITGALETPRKMETSSRWRTSKASQGRKQKFCWHSWSPDPRGSFYRGRIKVTLLPFRNS